MLFMVTYSTNLFVNGGTTLLKDNLIQTVEATTITNSLQCIAQFYIPRQVSCQPHVCMWNKVIW